MKGNVHPITPGAIKVNLPAIIQQKDFSCGAAALQAVCAYYGVGPAEEWEFARDLRMDPRVGSHPFQIKRTARKYGLRVAEEQPMSRSALTRYLRQRKPVLLMIQAWSDDTTRRRKVDYTDVWSDGHWVAAIGYDRSGVFFIDPSLEGARGYLSFPALDDRWHDTGPRGVRLRRYGMALWKPGMKRSAYDAYARVLD